MKAVDIKPGQLWKDTSDDKLFLVLSSVYRCVCGCEEEVLNILDHSDEGLFMIDLCAVQDRCLLIEDVV